MGRTFRGDKRLSHKERQKVKEFRRKRDHAQYYEEEPKRDGNKKTYNKDDYIN